MAKSDIPKKGDRRRYELKTLFEERMKNLLGDKEDFRKFAEIIHKRPRRFIRANTLKIDADELFERLRRKWEVSRPFKEFGEIMVVDSDLPPGELGNAIEHLLGYYYIQEISSMMSSIVLNPKPEDFVLDLCASPGSKTTQMAAMMENQGTIIANDIKIDRVKILNANLERCGVSNVVVTRNDGVGLCKRLGEKGFKFDKILLDTPCSGEGTLRSSPKTFRMWNLKVVKKLSREQKKLFANAVKCLKPEGEIVYSTCTHSPEENESVVDFALKNFPLKVVKILGTNDLTYQFNSELSGKKSMRSNNQSNDGFVRLPVRCRPGISEWGGKEFDSEVEKCCRIYPQDNDSEGFFICKFRLMEDIG